MAATRSMINDLLEGPNGTVFAIVAASVVVFLTLGEYQHIFTVESQADFVVPVEPDK